MDIGKWEVQGARVEKVSREDVVDVFYGCLLMKILIYDGYRHLIYKIEIVYSDCRISL